MVAQSKPMPATGVDPDADLNMFASSVQLTVVRGVTRRAHPLCRSIYVIMQNVCVVQRCRSRATWELERDVEELGKVGTVGEMRGAGGMQC